jgi:hypothetical protein
MKLLMEKWRRFLNEQGEEKVVVNKILNVPDYEQFVSQLGDAVNDPRVKAVLGSGLKDGNPGDETVGVSGGGGPCTQFLPIQNEIDLSKSLGYAATKPALVPKILQGGPISAADMGGSPIVSASDRYIVDGHHRWSQVYMINPDAAIETMDIKIADPEVALRAMQAAIAAVQGVVPSQEVEKGMNVFNMSSEAMTQWMQKNLGDQFIKLFVANSDAQDANGVIEQILFNISLMRENNKPVTDTTRGYMPQTGDPAQINKELAALKKGMINFKEPTE